MSNTTQLFLLSDHIKLSLLERQRAVALNLEPNSQGAHISRSLESLREGIEKLAASSPDLDQLANLRSQYNDLSRQFQGDNVPSTASETLNSPNDPSLAADFASARIIPAQASTGQHSSLKTSGGTRTKSLDPSKSVRFRENPSTTSPSSHEDAEEQNRRSLFPARYRDDDSQPDDGLDTSDNMTNQQIHAYHTQVLQQQDEQLDSLTESIGRQRHLSMQIGDELEGQIALLDEVDHGVERHQSRLEVAKRRLKGVSRKAGENWGMTTIIVLIVILVFLIAILK